MEYCGTTICQEEYTFCAVFVTGSAPKLLAPIHNGYLSFLHLSLPSLYVEDGRLWEGGEVGGGANSKDSKKAWSSLYYHVLWEAQSGCPVSRQGLKLSFRCSNMALYRTGDDNPPLSAVWRGVGRMPSLNTMYPDMLRIKSTRAP